MFIKFNFKNTSRKIKKEISTVEDLKAEAVKIFGEQVIYCDFLYQDEDLELVSIVEDSDLATCYEEANDIGKKCIKVILELSSPKTKRARSISQKKKVLINEDENEIKEIEEFSSLDDEDTDSFEEIDLSSDASEEKKKEVEEKIARKYNKLQAKINRKMKKINRIKNEKLGRCRKHRGGKRRHGRHHKNKNGSRSHSHKRGDRKGMPDFVKNIIEENKKHGNPWKQIKVLLENVKEEFKTYKGNPELISKVVEKCGNKVLNFVKEAVEEVKTENPELITALEEKRLAGNARRQERQQKKEAFRAQKQANKQARREEKEKLRAERQAKKQAKKQARLAQKAEPTSENVELREVEKAPAPVAKIQKEAQDCVIVEAYEGGITAVKKNDKPENPNKKRNQEVRRRVQILVPIFKDIPRPQLRKKVVEDLEAGKDVQATIQSLFA